MDSGAEAWLVEDESAREMLDRVLTERPLLLLPPLHRVPLRVGNIVELVGPTSSAKTHILIQAAITCVLPKQWKGVDYGGLGHLAMFIDLDCRFDILRFSELLNHRIMEAANGSSNKVGCQKGESEAQNATMKPYNEELFALCMRRFLYIRCYDSSEFLSTLKTLHYRLQKEKEAHGINVHFLLIDSIGAFHWVDRGSSSFLLEGDNRKSLHLQSVSQTVVQEIRKLLLVHPMLVMATKAAILGNRYSMNESRWNNRKWPSTDNPHSRSVTSSDQQVPYREFMPAVWQSFVTHRILVRATDDDFVNGEHRNVSIYRSEWLLPPLNSLDKFIVGDTGVFVLS
ncbi:DNA repair protein XRCC2 homolog isoform X1 [Herrania umbratica]|uniref:DNA repair protein XRCC2 homolog isoform X1 n=2 Tax=Herrania umbratica TaxID=108875 RepID=A0A6J1B258_9ROSI|nr:DNA repair protein XRCC2 homolog isoform X1 [Herrania umbratica]